MASTWSFKSQWHDTFGRKLATEIITKLLVLRSVLRCAATIVIGVMGVHS
jgi:hypothetical protein